MTAGDICGWSCNGTQTYQFNTQVVNTSSNYDILKLSLQIEGGLDAVISCPGTIGNDTCQELCFTDPSFCAGDPQYCDAYNCSLSSDCWCSFINVTKTILSTDGQVVGPVVPNISYYVMVPFIYSTKKTIFNLNANLQQSNKRNYISSCGVDFEYNFTTLIFNTINPLLISIAGQSFQYSGNLTVGQNYINVPVQSLFTFYGFDVYLYDGSLLDCTFHVDSSGISLCYKPSCSFCFDIITNVCVPGETKVLFWMVFIIILLCSIAFLILLILCIIKRVYLMYMFSACKTKVVNKFADRQSWSATQLNMMLIFCLFVSNVSSQCTDELVLNSPEQISCTYDGSETFCSASMSTLLTLNSVGSTACITISDPRTSVPISTLSFSYISGYFTCPMSLQYYTSDWSVVSSSQKQCPLDPYCTSTSNCNNFQSSNINAYGLLSGLSTTLPGVTSCLSTCGGWGCSCALFDSSCTYERWGINPKSTTYTVSNLQNCQFEALIQFTVTDQDNLTISTLIPHSGTASIAGISVNLQGSAPSTYQDLFTQSFISDGTNVYRYGSSIVGSPIVGTVGDIQSSSLTSLQRPSVSSFLIASNLCSVTPNTQSISLSCSKSGISNMLISAPKLPLSFPYGLMEANGTSVVLQLNSPPTVLLGINSNNFLVQRQISIVCPIQGGDSQLGSIVGNQAMNQAALVTGCYYCSSGFEVYVVLGSLCASGQVSLSITNNLNTQLSLNINTLTITTTWEAYIIPMTSSDSLVDFNLILTSGSESASISVIGNLVPASILLPNSSDTTQNIVSNQSSILTNLTNPFEEWWDGILPTIPSMKYIILTAIIIVILLIIIIPLICCLRP
jgi:hypothetical protein